MGWVEPTVLSCADAVLEPLEGGRAAELALAAGEIGETFRYFSRWPTDGSVGAMEAFIEYLRGPAGTVPFCVIEPKSGRAVGITTYLDIREAHRGLEIGWTWYAESVRGSRVNPACKLMLMRHAFEVLGAIRVCLKTDERNERSRAAITKLGAKFEGVWRRNIIMMDGFERSTAMYSVLRDEWPSVKAGLEQRLHG